MARDGVDVRIMARYSGVYHPKMVWLRSRGRHLLWTGSNNLTRDGLRSNVEFAALLTFGRAPRSLMQWAAEVHAASLEFSEPIIAEYERERRSFGERRVSLGTFTWSRRERAAPTETPRARLRAAGAPVDPIGSWDLALEVMPRETGTDGKQVQIPISVVGSFFSLSDRPGASRRVRLSPAWVNDARNLTLTVFRNHTARLVVKELDYRDRPCFLVFRRGRGRDEFTFDIISRSTAPYVYRLLAERCDSRTRHGGRRWALLSRGEKTPRRPGSR
jgi:hypothetical protein